MINVTARLAFLKSVIIYGLTALLLSHCSEFSTSGTAKTTGSAQASVTLKLPKGVSLKPGGQVAYTGNKRAATITAITLSVSAAGMTTITQPVSLTTLDATIDVPAGTARTFTALVKTGIGGSFTGSHTTDVSGASLNVSISMAISSALISGKLSAAVSKPGGKAAISTWAGAKIEVFDSTGALVGAGTAAADGTYSVDVPDGANYFVRAQIGNMVLKAYVPGTSGATAVNVNTTSTAAVMVLAQSLGVANLGDNGVSGAAAIAAANISTLYASILADPNLAVAAAALESEITANYDPNGTTPSVGTAGTAATSSISLIVSAVAPPSTTTVSPPAAPAGVWASAGNAQAFIGWTAVSGATSYNVYYRTAFGVTTVNGTKVTGATNGGAIASLTNGTTYYFVVTAVGAGGESTASGEVSATPIYLMGGGVQNGGLALNNAATASTAAVSTLAGLALTAGTTDATGSAARFGRPYGITTDGTYLFVADQTNNTIRKIVISTGVVTTLAGSGVAASTDGTGTGASFNNPTGITTDGTNLFVTDRLGHAIRKIVISTGVVTTLAGSGVAGAADGTGTAASFNNPNGIVTDGANLYIADQVNGSVRKIVIPTGVVTTFATGFTAPRGITTDGTNLYVANSGGNIIQKIVISTGIVTTLAGSGVAGSADGTGTAATFRLPLGITTDGANLYVVDNNNYTIRRIVISTGVVSTIAGLALTTGSTDGIGSAARFKFPNGITTNGSNLFVADGNNFTIRTIVPLMGGAVPKQLNSGGVVTTFAGAALATGSTDGTGVAARFNWPDGITTDGTNFYVADTVNCTIRQVVISTGVVTTLAGFAGVASSVDGTGGAARFNFPRGITTDGTNLYVVDGGSHTIRQVVISTGVVTTIAGTAPTSGSADGTGTAARFNFPEGITTDGTNLYVADGGNYTIRKIVISTGVVTTLAGTAGVTGSADGMGAAARFSYPKGITTDGTNLYVADFNGPTIRKVVISTGLVSTLAGTAGTLGALDGTGAAASFYGPDGITTDGTNLYVTDYWNHNIRKIVISSAVVTTLAGDTNMTQGSTDGTGTAARFKQPYGITTDGTSLYVADTGNATIRKIQ